jgi:vitamin B12 transporter
MRYFVIVIFFIFNCLSALASIHDTLNIAEVWVQEVKFVIPLNNAKTFDSLFLKQMQRLNLQQFLQENSAVQFKTYGVSGSSLMSIRGANASQSKVIWNGLALGSPMLNMNDVSILPIQAGDQISLVRGGNSAEQGTGALSGYVSLSSSPNFNENQYSLSIQHNSLQNQMLNTSILHSTKNFSSSTRILINNQLNKYDFKNYAEFNEPIQSQINSEVNQWAIIQSLYYRHKKSLYEAHVWYQENDRNLSPPLYNRNKSSYQLDKSFRGIVKQNIALSNKSSFENSLAYTRETIRFVSRVTLNNLDFEFFNSLSYFDQIQMNSKWKYQLNRFKQELSLYYTYEGAYVEDYAQYRIRNRLSLASASSYSFKNFLHIDFNNRIEKVISNNTSRLFASSLQCNFIVPKMQSMVVFMRLSRNYNLPGLNDLYWSPGGNPNLSSETSLEKASGLTFIHIRRNIKNKTQLTYYHSMVDNWILWQPSATENGFWSPQNLKQVLLQGIEFENEFSYSRRNYRINFNVFYTYNLAINRKAIHVNDLSVNKQLIYVPQEKYGFNLRFQYKASSVLFKQHFVAHRFTTTDNTNFLPSYHLFDVQLQQEFNIKNHMFNAQVYIDNIFNKNYESIPFQVMPARVLGIGFNYLFIKKKTQK